MERLSQGANVVMTSSTGGVYSQLMVACLAVPDNNLFEIALLKIAAGYTRT